MEGPEKCYECDGTGWWELGGPCDDQQERSRCKTCNGTGKVWASVEHEVVYEVDAQNLAEPWRSRQPGQMFLKTVMTTQGSGRYRLIVQPLKEGE